MKNIFKAKKANREIREAKGDIPFWMIAFHLNIHETTLVRWLRVELSDEEKQNILTAIKKIKQENMEAQIHEENKLDK